MRDQGEKRQAALALGLGRDGIGLPTGGQVLSTGRSTHVDNQAKPTSSFVHRRLPWIVAAVAFLLYALTLSDWARPDILGTLGSVGGWGLYVPVQAPLLHLLTRPLRLLPVSQQAFVLNGLAAVTAALVLALLARSVALLPFDRTLASRLRQPGPFALLSHRLAWLPPVLACALCGLERTFWEHATGLTGEMLDLLVFAYLIRCALEYRIDRRDRWLAKLALVYGLGVTNNYALVAFFPGFLGMVVRVKSWEFLRLRFLALLAGCGVAGLLLYLYLPLAAKIDGEVLGSVTSHLKAVLGSQWSALRAVPPWVVLMLSFSSVVPALLLSVRWSIIGPGAGGPAGAIVSLLHQGLQWVLLFGCVSIFYDPPWGPRALGHGLAFLPFYYLAALSVGYCAGYFLVLTTSSVGKGWPLKPGVLERLGPVAPGIALAVLVVAPTVLVARNWKPIRTTNASVLAGMADRMAAGLPAEGAYVLGDMADDVLLVEARSRQSRAHPRHVFVYTRWLESPQYQLRLARRHGARWPVAPDLAGRNAPLGNARLLDQIVALARSNQVYYLNPGFGPYFEVLRLQPQGLRWRVGFLPSDRPIPPPLTEREMEEARRFWEATAPTVEALVREPRSGRGGRYPELVYSRALNDWGVTLQRQGDAAGAARWFDLAWRLNTNNVQAQVNRAFNQELRPVSAPGQSAGGVPAPPTDPRLWESLRLLNGPADQPQWTTVAGQMFAQGGYYRQALIEFERARTLVPTNATIELWKESMEAMTRLRFGDVAGAERQAIELQSRFPEEEIACESLTHIYLVTGRLTNALASVDRQLRLNPGNPNALLNKAAFHIQLGQFAEAIPPMDQLLALQPKNHAARLNRAIAHLQSGHLDQAQGDYEVLVRATPRSADVHFGLGEIARQRHDTAKALACFTEYLKHGQPESEEYRMVARRVQELKSGSGSR